MEGARALRGCPVSLRQSLKIEKTAQTCQNAVCFFQLHCKIFSVCVYHQSAVLYTTFKIFPFELKILSVK